MNILTDILPITLEVAGNSYAIDSDFRAAITFEIMINDDEFPDELKLEQSKIIFFPDTKPPQKYNKETLEKILWFYRCGKDSIKVNSNNGDNSENIYSYECDSSYIFAAFWQQYKIDLESIKYLHWWKFKALFEGLSKETEFVKIMSYRATKIDDKMSKSEKDFYRKMKKLYAIPKSRNKVALKNALEEKLMRGEKI